MEPSEAAALVRRASVVTLLTKTQRSTGVVVYRATRASSNALQGGQLQSERDKEQCRLWLCLVLIVVIVVAILSTATNK